MTDTPQKITQGDIYTSVPFFESYSEENGEITINIIEYPYVAVLTQSCDLEQRFNTPSNNQQTNFSELPILDKKLISILVSPLYNVEHFLKGEHVSELGYTAQKIQGGRSKTPFNVIKNNQNPRYHYLKYPAIPEKLGELIMDFKHYFTISTEYLENNLNNRLHTIESLHRENLSHRFAFFLSRIGLPDNSTIHQTQP